MIVAGLATVAGARIPLKGVDVAGEVLGGHARIRVRQRYVNEEEKPVEAIYTFPLPSDATLAGFAMTCAGRRLEGVVKEREEAFRQYDDAVASGHGAAMLEQERPNVFTASVGNLLPGEETLVEVEYVQRVHADEGALRLVVPTLVAPRYFPGRPAGDRTGHGHADPTDRVPDADRISPPVGRPEYGLTLDVVFDLGRSLRIESPSHGVVALPEEGARVRVRLADEAAALDRDLVLTARGLGAAEPWTAVACHRRPGEAGTVSLTVVPDLYEAEGESGTRDVVFLVDTSGSMGGASIVEAKAALRLCLRHLRAGDRFDVVEFNSVSRAFAGRPVAFDQGALGRADGFVAGLRATGGTEMMHPLVEAVRSVPGGIVVLLTDGQVGNEAEILDAVLAARRGTRVHCIGIGTSVSDALLRDLARRTGGAVGFIHPGERVDEKVLALFARALAQRIEDPRVAFVGVDVAELAPDGEYPPIVDGEPWTLMGRYEGAGEGRVEIRGTLRGRPFLLEIPLALPAAAEQPALPRMWATERIRALSEAKVEGRRSAAMRERIVRLAVEHGVSCPHTAFVVVETREGDRRARGQPEVRVVPVSRPAGWDMFPGVAGAGVARCHRAVQVSPPRPGAPPRPAAPAAPSPRMASPARAREVSDVGACVDAMEMSAPPSPAASFGRAARGPVGGSAGGPSGLRDPALAVLSGLGADGLWPGEGGDGSPEARALRASARALLRLRDLGLDTAHPLHGALLRKAVEAVVRLARRAHDREPRLAEAALAAAWGVATGARTRGTVEAAIRTLPGTDLAARLGDAPAVRARAEECLGGVD